MSLPHHSYSALLLWFCGQTWLVWSWPDIRPSRSLQPAECCHAGDPATRQRTAGHSWLGLQMVVRNSIQTARLSQEGFSIRHNRRVPLRLAGQRAALPRVGFRHGLMCGRYR